VHGGLTEKMFLLAMFCPPYFQIRGAALVISQVVCETYRSSKLRSFSNILQYLL